MFYAILYEEYDRFSILNYLGNINIQLDVLKIIILYYIAGAKWYKK